MNPAGGMTTAAGHAAMAAVVAAAAAAAVAGSSAPSGALSVGSASGIAVRRTAHSGISDTWKRLDDMLGTVEEIRADVLQCFTIISSMASNPDKMNEAKTAFKMIMTYIKHQLTKLEEHIASLAMNYKLQTRQIGAPIVVCERATVNMRNSLRKRIMIQQQVRDRQHTAANAFDSLMRIRFPHLEPTPKRLRVGPSDSHTIELRTADLMTLVDNSISDPRVKQSCTYLDISKTEPGTITATVKGVCIASISYGKAFGTEKLMVDGISVCGIQETPGLWTKSQYKVFQKVAEHATEAIHYFTKHHPDLCLRNLLLWLSHYHDLFTESCKGCQKHLFYDSAMYLFLPPTYRSYDAGTSYHPQCYNILRG